jgi:hypothetical protein
MRAMRYSLTPTRAGFLALSSALVLLACAPALAKDPPARQSAKKPWPIAVLGQTKAKVDKILGKPVKMEKASSYREGTYRKAGFKELGVAFINGKLEVMEIVFPSAPASWEAALAKVGIPTAGVSATRGEARDGSVNYDLKGVKGIPAKWSITFFESETEPKLSLYGPNAT